MAKTRAHCPRSNSILDTLIDLVYLLPYLHQQQQISIRNPQTNMPQVIQ